MSDVQKQIAQVAQFMKVAGQAANTEPTPVSLGVANLRRSLILEEITGRNEFQYCSERDDLVGMLDGLCDILYVVYGAALTFGTTIDFEASANAVAAGKLAQAHQSINAVKNMIFDAEQFTVGYKEGQYHLVETSLTSIVKEVFNYAFIINVDLAGAFEEVHASNMSKFSETKEHAEESVAKRLLNGDEKYRNVYVTSVEHEGGLLWMIKRKEDHKILKSLNFFEPDLQKYV
jgi:Phosphoribosyl-ATP pyrophosphohydrolase.